MLIAINDDLINQAIYKTGLDAKTVLEKALKLLLTTEQPQTLAKFPDLTEFRAKIPPNKSASINMLTAMRDDERY
jgi:hypothetical protein